MKNIWKLSLTTLVLVISLTIIGYNSYAQTEGFNVKTPIEKIADSTTNFVKQIINDSKESPKKSIPKDLVCSAECFLFIPNIDIVESRGDFTGTGLMACRAPSSDKFTEPLYYKINHIHSFEESGGGLIILATNKDGMKSILGDDVNLSSDNVSAGPIGVIGKIEMKSFAAYAKYKNQAVTGTDLSGSLIEYSSKDTFNAYQGTVVPIEVLISPQDVPPVLRDFDSLLSDWTKDCK